MGGWLWPLGVAEGDGRHRNPPSAGRKQATHESHTCLPPLAQQPLAKSISAAPHSVPRSSAYQRLRGASQRQRPCSRVRPAHPAASPLSVRHLRAELAAASPPPEGHSRAGRCIAARVCVQVAVAGHGPAWTSTSRAIASTGRTPDQSACARCFRARLAPHLASRRRAWSCPANRLAAVPLAAAALAAEASHRANRRTVLHMLARRVRYCGRAAIAHQKRCQVRKPPKWRPSSRFQSWTGAAGACRVLGVGGPGELERKHQNVIAAVGIW